MKLLLLNQRVDLDDAGQGVAVDWMTAFAARVDKLFVITNAVGSALPSLGNAEILSVGGERRHSKARRILEFYRHLLRLVSRHRIDGCFVHMVPIFGVLSAPVLKPLGVPMIQWYTHSATPWEIRWSHRLVDRVVTASSESFRLPSRKVVVTGHGIPTTRFTRDNDRDARPPEPYTILAVGRFSPVKRYDLLVSAAARLRDRGAKFRVFIVGGVRGREDGAYLAAITDDIKRFGLEGVVTIVGAVARAEMLHWYRRADLLVHLCDSGLDKAVLEAMSCEIPVVTSGSGFRKLLASTGAALSVAHGDIEAVVAAIGEHMAMPRPVRRELGAALRSVVMAGHDQDNLVNQVLNQIADLNRIRHRRLAQLG